MGGMNIFGVLFVRDQVKPRHMENVDICIIIINILNIILLFKVSYYYYYITSLLNLNLKIKNIQTF